MALSSDKPGEDRKYILMLDMQGLKNKH